MLPCNVIVYVNEAGETLVSAIEPEAMMRGIDNPELGEIVPEVQRRLHAAVDRV